MRCTAYKVAPNDGLIQSETCRASNGKKVESQEFFVHLVGSYTYCRMLHGTYSVKMYQVFLRFTDLQVCKYTLSVD